MTEQFDAVVIGGGGEGVHVEVHKSNHGGNGESWEYRRDVNSGALDLYNPFDGDF